MLQKITAVIVAETKKAKVFAGAIHFLPSLIFVGKTGAYQSGASTGLYSTGRLLAVPTNIRLGWKLMAVANTLTYYDRADKDYSTGPRPQMTP